MALRRPQKVAALGLAASPSKEKFDGVEGWRREGPLEHFPCSVRLEGGGDGCLLGCSRPHWWGLID